MRLPRWLNTRTIVVVLVLFVFLVPVVPTTVFSYDLLPWYGQCTGLLTHDEPQGFVVNVYVSISYVLSGLAIGEWTQWTHNGVIGLVVVPGNGWNTVQFPPIGFGEVMCL